MEILNGLNSTHYNFLYDNLRKIVKDADSHGTTSVRFVSKALRSRNDEQFRHVSLEFRDRHDRLKVSEKYAFSMMSPDDWRDEYTIALPNIPHDLERIAEMEKTIPRMYVIGCMDCRHHVMDMLKMCYPIEDTKNFTLH